MREGFYDIMYLPQRALTTAVLDVQKKCDIQIAIHVRTKYLEGIQLKKVLPGSLVQSSPVWHVLMHDKCFPSPDTAVGVEHSGEPLWLAARVSQTLIPTVGKHRPNFSCCYAVANNPDELWRYTNHTIFARTEVLDRAVRTVLNPAVLVNAKDYVWHTTCLEKVTALLHQAVPLTESDGRVSFGARINFCGWEVSTSSKMPEGIHTEGAVISLLPGRLEYIASVGTLHLYFTWGGKSSSTFALGPTQPFQLLCYKTLPVK